MRVAISGASSFTGLWIANRLAQAGYQVDALLARDSASYSGLPQVRVRRLSSQVEKHFAIDAEGGAMKDWIQKNRPRVWIHHHHFMTHFRSPEYNLTRAHAVGLAPLPEIIQALGENQCGAVIFSGSYFEAGEGGQAADAPVSPYARSKTQVWHLLQELCARARMPLLKVVIPNPIGPFENDDRLIPSLIRSARSGTEFHLQTPLDQADNLPVTAVAETYADAVARGLRGESAILRPSAGAESNESLGQRVNDELIVKRLHLPAVSIRKPSAEVPKAPTWQKASGGNTPQDERKPRIFRNPTVPLAAIDWPLFWDFYAQELLGAGLITPVASAGR
ncbi:MAG: hypothetical protein C5B49_13885 [Bdellovibrio sp.]|nr:MAG: hypothetical protein C5B49_13885 [Bdellovibrio sp.]